MTLGRLCAFSLPLAVFAAAFPSIGAAIEVVTVEEYWELRLGSPEENLSAPQVTMAMSPTADLSDCYFIFNVNYLTVPEYAPGGMEVQHWHGASIVDSQSNSIASPLWTSRDEVTWVQRLHLEAGQLTFEVDDGESDSWGSFGGEELRLQVESDLANLNDYRPGTSIQESGVGYAGNRVRSLTLSRLVWITDDGQTFELTAPIDVDTDLDP